MPTEGHRPPPPRYDHDEVDLKVLATLRASDQLTYRDLGRRTGFGMYVLTHSVERLRARGLVIPGVAGRSGFLIAVKGG